MSASASIQIGTEVISVRPDDRYEESSRKRAIEPDALYTANEAAALLSLHPDTLRKKLRCSTIAGRRRVGRWRIRGAELLKLA